MRLLFITLADIENISDHGIYTDLLREFRDRGHGVYIISPSQRRCGRSTEVIINDGVTILRVRTGNITKAGIVEKAVSTVLIQYQFTSAIKKFFRDIRFDMVLYSTPPVTFDRVVDYIKRRDGCMSYLLLKDIWPQGAVDLGVLKIGGLAWRYFRRKEKRLYALSDRIGCMSPANVTYLLDHNDEISPSRVEVCPNSIEPNPVRISMEHCYQARDAYGIPRDSVVLIFGGNLGDHRGWAFA